MKETVICLYVRQSKQCSLVDQIGRGVCS